MADRTDLPERPRDLPGDMGDALDAHASNPHDLREAIIYAHELLNDHHKPTLDIEPQEDEEILSLTEHGEYTAVVKRHRGQEDAFLYHARSEPRPEGEDHLRWVLMGKVDPDDL